MKMTAGHVIPKKTYYAVFAALMVLLAATVGVAFVHLGEWNVVAAMTIAVAKAVLIILYFMHVRYSSHVTWMFVGAGFFWLGILLVLSMSDYLTRAWLPAPTGWLP
jgi:cytochrome c oxidase subunit IV